MAKFVLKNCGEARMVTLTRVFLLCFLMYLIFLILDTDLYSITSLLLLQLGLLLGGLGLMAQNLLF